jgi:hypothetical protein
VRIIFEEVDSELFFEVILSPYDVERIESYTGIVREYLIDFQGIKNINVFVRKEGQLCHLSKARKQNLKKAFQRIFGEKLPQENHKNKPLQ